MTGATRTGGHGRVAPWVLRARGARQAREHETADRAPGQAWSATFTVTRGPATGSSHRPCTEPHTEPPYPEPRTEPRTESCGTAVFQSPVRAGQGGSFTDSVPALAAGALLIAVAAAGAVYRLRRKSPAADA